MASIELKNVIKRYGSGKTANQVIHGVNAQIADGEFIVIVGPSGCGKSTLLRMVAGLEEVSDGQVCIGGKVVNDLEPSDRDIAMVFQNYALYPHMSVFDNMAYGLKIAKVPKDEIRALVGRQAAEGWTIDELAAELERSGVTRSAARAAIIARTETTRAYSLGSIAAFQVSGVVDRLEWLTAQDEKTCPECAALDGQVAAMGQSFDGGVMFPPAHPNCRCAILPVLKED